MKTLLVLSALAAIASARLVDQNLLAKEICYPKYGCFGTESPWTSPRRSMSALPNAPYEVGTRFILFTRGNEETEQIGYELLPDQDAILRFSDFNATRKTYFLIHGFTDSHKVDWLWRTKDLLLQNEDANVFALDWANGARKYLQATANARLVGAMMAYMINYLEQKADLRAEDIHVVSHCIGSHVAGYAGNRLSGRFARITAIDPTDLYFGNTDPIVRLDETDAQYVEVIHSNADSWTNFGLGIPGAIGHVDIFPNGGKKQPGCTDTLGSIIKELIELLFLDFDGALSTRACSHARAADYYPDSIANKDNCAFVAFPCNSYSDYENGKCYQQCSEAGNCLSLGYNAKSQGVNSGTYYVRTTDGAKTGSYCKQVVQLQIPAQFIDLQQEQTIGSITLRVQAEDGTLSEKFALTNNDKISPGLLLQNWIEVPQTILKNPNEKPSLVLRYTRRGALQAKTVELDNVNLIVINPDLSSTTISYAGVTLTTGQDAVVTN